jgi:hypothetical protein
MKTALGMVLAFASGCLMPPEERPQALIVCHNANCARATDPSMDDKLATLEESLSLEYRGRPAIDGVEIDTMWDRSRSACIFAHDLEHALDPRELALQAADRVVAHLRRDDDVSWTGDQFFIKIELKPQVTVDGLPHAPEELAAHIDCVFEMADRIIAAAIETGRELELGFDSEVVALLRAVAAHPRWAGKNPYPNVHLRLISSVHAIGLEPHDLRSLTAHAHDGIDTLSFHATRTPTGVVDDYASLGVELMLWMLDAAPETLSAMHRYEPRYVVTSEAIFFRRWEEQ